MVYPLLDLKIDMNRGITLIETMVYMSLLSLLMIGVFSSVLGLVGMQTNRPSIEDHDYQMLIKNFHE